MRQLNIQSKLFAPASLVFAVLLAAVFSSCSFNRLFLHPERLPDNLNTINIIRKPAGDTVRLSIAKGFQPSFTYSNGKLLDPDITVEAVVFKGSSGNRLVGWYLKPVEVKHNIAILLLHGNAGNVTSKYYAATAFAKRGFPIFIFDYSGFGFSDGKATRDNVLKDSQAALDYLLGRVDVSGSKVLIYGQSLGGHAALVLAQRNQERIGGVMSEGAFSSHKDIAALHIHPFGFVARLLVAEKYSAKKSIRKIHKPVLIVHSSEDETIPYRMGQKLFSRANEPKSFYTISRSHIMGPAYFADSMAARIVKLVNAQ